jgi:hypothetical protein
MSSGLVPAWLQWWQFNSALSKGSGTFMVFPFVDQP